MSVRLSNWHDKKLQPVFEDLRAKDSALEAQDAQLARVDAALQAQLDAKFLQLQNTLTGNMNTLYTRMLPIGSVIMWGLDLSLKPDNFEVCDGKKTFMYQGKSYTVPDLQGRFALGVGGSYGFKATGGEASVTLNQNQMPSHSHTGTTVAAGEHNHKMNFIATPRGGGSGYVMVDASTINNPSPDWYHHTYNSGNHTHSFSTDATGGGQAHNNMPPYFGLYYLIKIAN